MENRFSLREAQRLESEPRTIKAFGSTTDRTHLERDAQDGHSASVTLGSVMRRHLPASMVCAPWHQRVNSAGAEREIWCNAAPQSFHSARSRAKAQYSGGIGALRQPLVL